MAKKNNPSKLGEILKNITKKSIQDEAIKERAKSYDVRKIFEQMELDLISSMHRAFYFHQSEQAKEGFEWEQWQLTKLREMEKYRKRNKDIVDSYSKPIQQAIDRELRGNYSKGQNRFKTFLDKVKGFFGWKSKSHSSIEFPKDIQEVQTVREYIHKELGRPGAVPQETNFFGVNDKKLEVLIETVNKDLNKAQYSVLRKMDDVYRQTIFKSHMYLQNGVKTLPQAVDMATKDFLAKGIDSITYKNGARVNIASYAEMCLRTANHRATLLGEGKKRDEYGIHTVVVSAHANTCPKCEPWQGKVLIDDVFSHGTKLDGDYPLLSEAVTAGLLHPNCRHSITTFFPGITNLPKVPDGKEAIKLYEAEQKQRYLERQIRKWKRIETGSVYEENKIKAANNVRKLQNRLKQHIKDNNELRINNSRTEIKEFNPKVHKEYLKKYDERVKIKRDGATRAEEFSKYWGEASLKETINKFVPNATASGVTEKGKIIYTSKDTKLQVVYDTKGNYFRIEDSSRTDKKRYLDIEGNDFTNIVENGKKRGTTKAEYQSRTHFKNSDKEDN
ncbi:phage minor capsid protein [Clostridium paraputrificum]|uniref:phage minor capsid protein n=1 Tax=Clostridium paraputrificum TaxID=29363 RepID=UPI001899C2F6|nr:phage minor capsid protein [Clostridium paraputrificum]